MHKGLFICDLQAVWGLFGLDPDEVRTRLLPDVVAEQAEMFLINGDMQSNLYTSSRAMHSAILGLLQVRSCGTSRACKSKATRWIWFAGRWQAR